MSITRFKHLTRFSRYPFAFREDPPEGGDGDVTFTPEQQAKVDKIVESRLARQASKFSEQTEKNKELVTQLEEFKSKTKMSAEELDTLNAQITSLKSTYQSDKEAAAEREKQLITEHKQRVEELEASSTKYKSLFEQHVASQELLAAGSNPAHKAVVPQQLVQMFGSQVKVIEVTDEQGNGTGKYTTSMTFLGKGKKGEMEEMTKPVSEAIAKIHEDGTYGNMFETTLKAGAGGTPGKFAGQGKAKVDAQNPPHPDNYNSMDEWKVDFDAWREEFGKKK